MSNSQHKITSLTALSDIAEKARHNGLKIVHCHGTFDLLHIGHVRHFEQAHANGDILIVTLTADEHVLKGADRPIFSQLLRAEMIASQSSVDWVAIVNDKSGLPAINAIKPHFYVKGIDYKNHEDDTTDKITVEKKTVEKHGGQLILTDDITFSSSNLLNKYFTSHSDGITDIIDDFKKRGGIEYFLKKIETIQDKKILFVGETIIDKYTYVNVLGKSIKESTLSTLYDSSEIFAGGVIAAANHVSPLCNEVRIITTLGQDQPYHNIVKQALHNNITLYPTFLDDRPTIRKERFVEHSYVRKMFEVYHMNDTLISSQAEHKLLQQLDKQLAWADIVIVTDFGHGMMTQKVIDILCNKAKFLAVNVQTNSGNRGYNLFTKFPRADYLCIDEPELRLALQNKFDDIPTLLNTTLKNYNEYDRTIITHGKFGCYTYAKNQETIKIPALTTKIVDTIGAGDAFLSITAPLVAVGMPLDKVAFIGNIAGAIKVRIIGHRSSIDKAMLLKYIETLLK